MRNAMYVGLCWAMTLGLVAVALGQQRPTVGDQAPQVQQATGLPAVFVPAAGANDAQQNSANQYGNFGGQLAMPAPDRSLIIGSTQTSRPETNDGQRRGELGVWMAESGGPGVRILRVTQGSAAEQAGLRVGDVILQVNGRGATSPQGAAQLIRRIPVGQSGALTVWRDGDQQNLQVTMRPAREPARDLANDASHQVGFGAGESSASGDLASRTMRLEQQINSLTQELATLRQELAQLRTAGPVQTGFTADANQSAPPREPLPRYNEAPRTPAAAPANPVAPPPGFEPTGEKPATPAADAAKPVAPPAPAAEKSSSDLFGSGSAQPKSEEKAKSEEKSKAGDKGGADDLFK